ncbi:MAG: hypothetical protein V2A66_02580 [Pseudomonadota bacterium]
MINKVEGAVSQPKLEQRNFARQLAAFMKAKKAGDFEKKEVLYNDHDHPKDYATGVGVPLSAFFHIVPEARMAKGEEAKLAAVEKFFDGWEQVKDKKGRPCILGYEKDNSIVAQQKLASRSMVFEPEEEERPTAVVGKNAAGIPTDKAAVPFGKEPPPFPKK